MIAQSLGNIAKLHTALGNGDALAAQQAAARVVRRSQTQCAGAGCERRQREDGAALDQCSGCLRTYYCSTACQTADWKAGHRAECKALAAEGRAAAAAALAAETMAARAR